MVITIIIGAIVAAISITLYELYFQKERLVKMGDDHILTSIDQVVGKLLRDVMLVREAVKKVLFLWPGH